MSAAADVYYRYERGGLWPLRLLRRVRLRQPGWTRPRILGPFGTPRVARAMSPDLKRGGFHAIVNFFSKALPGMLEVGLPYLLGLSAGVGTAILSHNPLFVLAAYGAIKGGSEVIKVALRERGLLIGDRLGIPRTPYDQRQDTRMTAIEERTVPMRREVSEIAAALVQLLRNDAAPGWPIGGPASQGDMPQAPDPEPAPSPGADERARIIERLREIALREPGRALSKDSPSPPGPAL